MIKIENHPKSQNFCHIITLVIVEQNDASKDKRHSCPSCLEAGEDSDVEKDVGRVLLEAQRH
jgi:hypothetical protein